MCSGGAVLFVAGGGLIVVHAPPPFFAFLLLFCLEKGIKGGAIKEAKAKAVFGKGDKGAFRRDDTKVEEDSPAKDGLKLGSVLLGRCFSGVIILTCRGFRVPGSI